MQVSSRKGASLKIDLLDQVFSKKVDPEGHLQDSLDHLDQVFSENLDPDDQVSWPGYDIPEAQHPPGLSVSFSQV
ncbi:MAG: hypothetical protein AB7W16_22490 [Candidatus Obscuribacterales bacterium]